MNGNLQQIISGQTKIQSGFRQYLLDDGKAERTVQSYVIIVSHFILYVRENKVRPLSELTRQDVLVFRKAKVSLRNRLIGSMFLIVNLYLDITFYT